MATRQRTRVGHFCGALCRARAAQAAARARLEVGVLGLITKARDAYGAQGAPTCKRARMHPYRSPAIGDRRAAACQRVSPTALACPAAECGF